MTDDFLVINASSDDFGGGALLFARSGDVWSIDKLLTPFELQPDTLFQSIDIKGETLVLGAPNQSGLGGENGSGAVFVYTRQPDGTWNYDVIDNPGGDLRFAGFGSRARIISETQIVVYA